jgi:hypothetical protein
LTKWPQCRKCEVIGAELDLDLANSDVSRCLACLPQLVHDIFVEEGTGNGTDIATVEKAQRSSRVEVLYSSRCAVPRGFVDTHFMDSRFLQIGGTAPNVYPKVRIRTGRSARVVVQTNVC